MLSLVATLFLLPTKTEANFDIFLLSDIRLQGLQRVSAGTVFNELPVNIGDEIDSFVSGDIVRSLFNTGLFDDITVERDEEVLIISLNERPAIEAIEIDGNKAIKTEQIYKEVNERLLEELDYVRERKLMEIFKIIFEKKNYVNIPKVYKDLSTDKLITMEWLNGDHILKFKNKSLSQRNKIAKNIPVGRIAKPDEFIQLILFLASEKSSYITGTAIPIDGGSSKSIF